MTNVVSNASPPIILAKAELIDLLPDQFGGVKVPKAVWDEIMAGPQDDPMRKAIDKTPWIEQVRIEPPMSPLAFYNLGRGESEVIEYARLNPGSIALLDDRAARKVASILGVKAYGTLSIAARHASRNPSVPFEHLIDRLKKAGLYLDKALIESVKTKINETRKPD
jgi:predicted nucleic acid-binding protein